jgi:phosphate:Na+ symporter
MQLDVLRDLKRINSHLAAVAYPILEEAGQLRSPLRRNKSDEDVSLNHIDDTVNPSPT